MNYIFIYLFYIIYNKQVLSVNFKTKGYCPRTNYLLHFKFELGNSIINCSNFDLDASKFFKKITRLNIYSKNEFLYQLELFLNCIKYLSIKK